MFIINMAIALIEHRADVEVIVDGHTALVGKTAALSLCLPHFDLWAESDS